VFDVVDTDDLDIFPTWCRLFVHASSPSDAVWRFHWLSRRQSHSQEIHRSAICWYVSDDC